MKIRSTLLLTGLFTQLCFLSQAASYSTTNAGAWSDDMNWNNAAVDNDGSITAGTDIYTINHHMTYTGSMNFSGSNTYVIGATGKLTIISGDFTAGGGGIYDFSIAAGGILSVDGDVFINGSVSSQSFTTNGSIEAANYNFTNSASIFFGTQSTVTATEDFTYNQNSSGSITIEGGQWLIGQTMELKGSPDITFGAVEDMDRFEVGQHLLLTGFSSQDIIFNGTVDIDSLTAEPTNDNIMFNDSLIIARGLYLQMSDNDNFITNGHVTIGNGVKATGGDLHASNGNWTIGNNMETSGSADLDFNTNGRVSILGNLTMGSTSSGGQDFDIPVIIGGSLNLTGAKSVDFADSLTVTGSVNLTSTSNVDLIANGVTQFSNGMTVSNSSGLLVEPTSTLDLSGDVEYSSTSSGKIIIDGDVTLNGNFNTYGSAGGEVNGNLTVTGNWDRNTNTNSSGTWTIDGYMDLQGNYEAESISASLTINGTWDIGGDMELGDNSSAQIINNGITHLYGNGTVLGFAILDCDGTTNLGEWYSSGAAGCAICTSGSMNCALPVSLLSLTAHQTEGELHIQWTTISEMDNDYFTVFLAAKEGQFHREFVVEPSDNGYNPYSLIIPTSQLPSTELSINLHQTDFDGTESYLGSTSTKTLKPQPTVNPNPTHGLTYLNHAWDWTITNELGQVVKTGKKREIDISSMPSGIYYLQVDKNLIKLSKL